MRCLPLSSQCRSAIRKCWAFRLQWSVTNSQANRIHRTQSAWAPKSQMSEKNKHAFPIQIILRSCSIGHILSQIHPFCHESACMCWKAAERLQVRLFRHCSLDHLAVFAALKGVVVQLKSAGSTDRGTTKSPSPENFSVLLKDSFAPAAEVCPLPKPHPSKWGVWYSCLASCQKETIHSKHYWEPSMIIHKTGHFLQAEPIYQEELQHWPPSTETTSALPPRIRC